MGSTGANAGAGKKSNGLPEATTITSNAQIKELQNQMGQTGNEAGDANTNPTNKLYVNSGKSFNINAYLNSDGDSIVSPYTDWDNYISTNWVKNAIETIDKGVKPLPTSVNVSRFVDADSLGYILGNTGFNSGNFNSLLNSLQSDKSAGKDFTTALQNTNYTHKGYTSTTYVGDHGSYGDRDIRLNMVMRAGTPAIVTNNHAEHEILGGRNLNYHFTGGWRVETTSSGKKQLVLDVYV